MDPVVDIGIDIHICSVYGAYVVLQYVACVDAHTVAGVLGSISVSFAVQ